MSLPTRLYKYEPFTAQSLQNLKDQVIYFASPKTFNDPYDCALSPRIKVPSDKEVEKIRKHYLAKPELDERVRREFENAPTENLRQVFIRNGQQTLQDGVERFLSQRGVSCFSERVDSLLMWSHYGDSFKGFCLEFSTQAAPFHMFKKVSYAQDMAEFDVVPILCDEGVDIVTQLYCTKAIDWAYEYEWRGIHEKAGTPYGYSADALTGVFVGPEMSSTAFEIIALVLAGQNDRVQLWKGERSKSSFSVEFKPVTYTSHLQAKRLGLI